MPVRNIHERSFAASPEQLGALLDSLASEHGRLWPRERWPAMRFDRPLGAGAMGGHGPIRYIVSHYQPGRSIVFTFTSPRGFRGQHGFEIESTQDDTVPLRHWLEMATKGKARLSWLLVYRPLHDVLIEDALDLATSALGGTPLPRPWSPWGNLLRRILERRSKNPRR